ncbi:hypothetical protein QR680_005046 [Steinernema hermaphroditum]|uniref:HTH OST-type domain-containing protein n=1 Tax=Steinernema hermaphroditum TaxID=289476 RepID=A0AA39HQP2_9BILA|nr:hypothetical protein QR680_005046 [Steinernema hermaphroditum]
MAELSDEEYERLVKDFKDKLRGSLIHAGKDGVRVDRLVKEYKADWNEDFPTQRLTYRCHEDLLRDCDDTVMLVQVERKWHAVIVPDKSTSHVTALVNATDRKSKKKKPMNRRHGLRGGGFQHITPYTLVRLVRTPYTLVRLVRTPYTLVHPVHRPYTFVPLVRKPYTSMLLVHRPHNFVHLVHRPYTSIHLVRRPYTSVHLVHKPYTSMHLVRRPYIFVHLTRRPFTNVDLSRKPLTFLRLTRRPFKYVSLARRPNKYVRLTRRPNKYVRLTRRPNKYIYERSENGVFNFFDLIGGVNLPEDSHLFIQRLLQEYGDYFSFSFTPFAPLLFPSPNAPHLAN